MDTDARRLIRNFLIELILYALLVAIYFVLVLSTIGDWLTELYYENLNLYAFVALALIVTQAVVLEMVTTFLIERLGLERLE
jgi:hypothetical protein